MDPVSIRAVARGRAVGPYLLARDEWLKEYAGSFMLATDSVPYVAVSRIVRADGRVGYVCASCTAPSVTLPAVAENIRLNVNIPAVRDHLVRMGCPAKFRDVPAAVWCWGLGLRVVDALHSVAQLCDSTARYSVWVRRSVAGKYGWNVHWIPPQGCVDPAAARQVIFEQEDAAALHAGCILWVDADEHGPAGWLVPLPDGEIGFFPEMFP